MKTQPSRGQVLQQRPLIGTIECPQTSNRRAERRAWIAASGDDLPWCPAWAGAVPRRWSWRRPQWWRGLSVSEPAVAWAKPADVGGSHSAGGPAPWAADDRR